MINKPSGSLFEESEETNIGIGPCECGGRIWMLHDLAGPSEVMQMAVDYAIAREECDIAVYVQKIMALREKMMGLQVCNTCFKCTGGSREA